jgi:microcystin synthetase protein McyJ
MSDRKFWGRVTQERAVETFYSVGVERYGDFHDGYLNFGLWSGGARDYVEAAENLVRRLGGMSSLNPGSVLLDVACGMGTQDLYLLKEFSPRRIDALDATWGHIERGREQARRAGVCDRVHFHHGTATRLPFADACFTNVLSIEGAVHFHTREGFLREARRVLRPGGTLVLSDYTLKRRPRNLLEKFVVGSVRRLWKVPRENVLLAAQYRESLERSGFGDVHLEEIGADVIPGYYFEQRRPETIRELARIRGFIAGRLGGIIDVAVYRAYTMGLVEYVLARAVKP